jgi:hypothetical protein
MSSFEQDVIKMITELRRDMSTIQERVSTIKDRVDVFEETQRLANKHKCCHKNGVVKCNDLCLSSYNSEILNTRIASESQVQHYYELKLKYVPQCGVPGQCEFASSYALGVYLQYFPTTNPVQLRGLLYSNTPTASLRMTDGVAPAQFSVEFNGTVEFVRDENSCIWKKNTVCTTRRTLSGCRHAVLLVAIDGSPVIIDWSVKQFVSTNNFVFVADLSGIESRL